MKVSELGKNLKRYRKEKNLSLNKLKDLAGVGYATLHDVENGKKPNLSVPILEKISKVLEVSIEDLLGLEVVHHTVDDIEKTLSAILESDELELDGIELTEKEIEELNYLFKFGIESLRRRRTNN
ncbi:MAG: helix-turn-helix domain-containing protein [Sarcina sp.]